MLGVGLSIGIEKKNREKWGGGILSVGYKNPDATADTTMVATGLFIVALVPGIRQPGERPCPWLGVFHPV